MTTNLGQDTTVLGQGTYGCVLTPAFPCNPSDPDNVEIKKVTKVFSDNQEIKEEKANMHRLNLKKIDPNEDYSIYKFFLCKYPFQMKAVVKSKCKGFEKAKIKSVALNYRQASATLEQVINQINWTDVNTSILLHQLKNIIKGIFVFNEKGRFHMDLTDRNVMQEKKFEIVENNPFKMIDFGLSQVGEKFTEEVNYTDYYDSWPIEIYELSKKKQGLQMVLYMNTFFEKSKTTFAPLYNEGIWNEDILRKRMQLQKGKGLEVLYYVDPWSFIVILCDIYVKIPDMLEAKPKLKELLTNLSSKPMMAKEVYDLFKTFLNKLSYQPPMMLMKSKKKKSTRVVGGRGSMKKTKRQILKKRTHRKSRKLNKKY